MTDAKLPALEERFAELKGVQDAAISWGAGALRSSSSTASAARRPTGRSSPRSSSRTTGCSFLTCPATAGRRPCLPSRASSRSRIGWRSSPRVRDAACARSSGIRSGDGGARARAAASRRRLCRRARSRSRAQLGSIWGRQLQSVFSTVRPGRLARAGAAWSRVRSLLRRFVFGFVSVADPGSADQRGCRGIPRGAAAAHGRRQRVAGVARGRPASGARGGALPGAGPLGSGRHCSCRSTTRSSTRAGCAHRCASFRVADISSSASAPDACADAIDDFLGDGGLERHHLPA